MKKFVQLFSPTTGLPLTGRGITLQRVFPNDGAQIALSEVGNGVYKAATIPQGLYQAWDTTTGPIGGSGVDLEQQVDAGAALMAEPVVAAGASGFYAFNKTWQVPGVSDITGLESRLEADEAELGALQTGIDANAGAVNTEATIRAYADAALAKAINAIAVPAVKPSTRDGWCITVREAFNRTLSGKDFTNSLVSSEGLFPRTPNGGDLLFPTDPADGIAYPLAVLPTYNGAHADIVYAKWDTPLALKDVSSGTAYSLTSELSVALTEKVRDVNWFFFPSPSVGSSTTQEATLILSMVQTSDCDFTVYVKVDMSATGIAVTNYDTIWLFVNDGTKLLSYLFDIQSAMVTAFSATDHPKQAKFAVRFKRTNGALFTGIRQVSFQVGA